LKLTEALLERLAWCCRRSQGVGGVLKAVAGVCLIGPTAGQQPSLITVRPAGPPVHSGVGRLVYDSVTIGQLEGAPEYTFASVRQVLEKNGSIYVIDGSDLGTPALRVYDSRGRYTRDIGRKGSGPAEYHHLDGVAVLPDQSIVVLDGLLRVLKVYSAAGKLLRTWPAAYNVLHNSNPLPMSAGPTGIISILHSPSGSEEKELAGFDPREVVLLRPDGSPLEQRKPPPTRGMKLVVKRDGKSTTGTPVPYAPEGRWFWSPLGYFVKTDGEDYSIDLLQPRQTLRITRVVAPVQVPSGEREELRAIRQKWLDGLKGEQTGTLDIPSFKPAINPYIIFDADGRLLVSVATPSERFNPTEKREFNGRLVPQVGWRSPVRYDIFEPDGKYIGQFEVPHGMRVMFVRGELVWVVVRDNVDVEYVKKYRIVWG
jgi:hypothetical protein